MSITKSIAIALGILVATRATLPAADYIWIEGESSTRNTMRPHSWYDNVTRNSLSGKQWLSHFAGGTPPQAEFQFAVSQRGEYYFWIRANSVARARLSYQLDGGAWVEVDFTHAIENLNIAADGKPDMRFISWVDAGKVALAAGRHTIRFKFHSANQNHGGLDCFVFSRKPFRPRGALKPGEKSGHANPGYFAWEPDVDDFNDTALIDLAGLNEDLAGEGGYVRAVGNDFLLADGRKVKFWAVNVGPALSALDHPSHVYLAKNLAKRGVNLVRLHGGIYASRNPAVDLSRLDNLHHMVAALRQEGIYVELSFYFPLWFFLDDGDQTPFMLLYFDEEMQRIYFHWAEQLLNTKNPYTGVPLGKDPCVAIVEVINEDSHFFWTFGKKNMAASRWRNFTEIYGQWLKKRYGSLQRAVAAWGGAGEPGDDPAAGRMELESAWAMTSAGVQANPKKRKRVADQVRFLTENMRGFYQRAAEFFRDQCGYRGLVSASNWHTADARMLDALERYCYTAGDVIDHHGYYDHNHQGKNAHWSVRPGQTFRSQSALDLRDANPLPYVETDGYPHITSEIGWPMPNMYRAEAAFLTAGYGSLWGLDGIVHFAVGSPGWDRSVRKFPLSNPVALGSYFAAALVYRHQDVQEAPAVVVDNLRLEDLYQMKGTKVYVGAALDQFRAAQIPDDKRGRGTAAGIDPLLFYVGRVVRNFQGNPAESTTISSSRYIDRNAKTIQSITGELAWDYGAGVATINTPKAQGAAGFLGKFGTVALVSVTIEMKNDYGTVLVVAMDDRPLAESEKILVQCMSVDQLYGWETSDAGGAGGTIRNVGSAPWGVQRFDVSVTLKLKGNTPTKVTACDENGYPTGKVVQTSGDASQFTVKIDQTTAYTVVQR